MPAGSIRVFLIDDHVLYRDSMVAVLRAEKDLEVVGQGSSVEQAKRAWRSASRTWFCAS